MQRSDGALKIEYSYTFDIPREIVWNLLQNEAVLQKAIPGCKSLSQMEEGVYHAELGLNVGPVKGVFTGQVQLTDRQEPSFYRLLVRGKGMPGEIDAVADMQLDETGQGVLLTCTAVVKVTGVLASVGQRVMSGVAKLVLGQFFKAADKEMKLLAS
jgi:carbon monoxide dehydrogenase subunit G